MEGGPKKEAVSRKPAALETQQKQTVWKCKVQSVCRKCINQLTGKHAQRDIVASTGGTNRPVT